MATITHVQGREILDSRGTPTVEAEVKLSNGIFARASVPSGASTGQREAVELRDGDKKRYAGKGVLQAVQAINQAIQACLIQQDPCEQALIDQHLIELDGTSNKSRLGANAILAVSLAVAKAAAQSMGQPLYAYLQQRTYQLPIPLMNIINGGAHANNNLDIQEFMIVPIGATNFSEALRYGVEVFQALKKLLSEQGFSVAVGDEGGFAPNLANHEAALGLIMKAIERAGFQPGEEIALALDIASSEFYRDNYYYLSSEKRQLDAMEFTAYQAAWLNQYPIISIEDGMAENDWHGWQYLTETLGNKIQLVGDDLFVTHTTLLQRGLEEKVANAILIKPNQVGTLTETLAAVQLAVEANYAAIISHRSGETEDTSIADLAVATGVGQIKTGSLCRMDRIAKYNQLLRIEAELGITATYLGKFNFTRTA